MAGTPPLPERERASTVSGAKPAALVILGALSIVFSWWTWQEGAYFGTVMLPGLIALCCVTAMITGAAPWHVDFRQARAAAVTLAALVGLGLWTLLSAFWSPAPDVAVFDAQRVFGYALVFVLGLLLCNLLGSRRQLSLAPVVVAAALGGVATIVALVSSQDPRSLLEYDGTLDYPLGYRNANAAFFAIALFPALGLAAERGLDKRLRAAATGTATLCISLFLLCQSRGSAPAIVLAVVVYLLLSPVRVRALSWLVLAAVPAVLAFPTLTELYIAVNDSGLSRSVDEMHNVGLFVAIVAIAGVVVGALGTLLEDRLPSLGIGTAAANRWVAVILTVVAVAGATVFVSAVGDPVDWVGQRIDEIREGGSPGASGVSRFSLNASSNRYDLWRVAVDDFTEDPLLGDGAGGFRYTYTQKREVSHQDARDAHSVELELLAELGLPGLTLLIVLLVAGTAAVTRARRLGPSAAGLGAITVASGTYWLAHSSIDWFWPYPALTAPVMMMLGAACAPAALALHPASKRSWRPWLIGSLVILALSAVPPFLSERYVNNAYSGWRDDIGRAYDDLGRAQSLNPLSDGPLLAEGAIARAVGDRTRALSAFRKAAAKRPEEWAAHYLIAALEADSDLPVARNEITVALRLNPLSKPVRKLARKLEARDDPG